MRLRTIIAASLGSTLFLIAGVSAASAQQYNWTGFSIYGGVGAAWFDGDVGLNDTTRYRKGIVCKSIDRTPYNHRSCHKRSFFRKSGTNNIGSSLNGSPGVLGTVGVAGDIEATPGVVVGAFADIDWSNADVDFSGSSTSTIKRFRKHKHKFTLTSSTSANGSMDYDYSYTIGGRVGVLSLNRQALFYFLGGYTRLELGGASAMVDNSINLNIKSHYYEKNIGYAADSISVNLPDSFDGYTVGVGTQVKLSQAWSMKLEGRYSAFESKSVKYSQTTKIDKTLGYTKYGCDGPCKRILRKSASSSGTFNVDPEL